MKKKIAFIKYGGLSTGGTERWLQEAAIILNKKYHVSYYYTEHNLDSDRYKYLAQNDIELKKITVGKRSHTDTQDWINTNFWEIFDETYYDVIQTAKLCKKEYPFYLLNKPVIEKIAFGTHFDDSDNIIFTITPSEWLRQKWISNGGIDSRSICIPVPVRKPCICNDFRKELDIPDDAVVAGFHQRVDDNIYSFIPLLAFKLVASKNTFFLIKGGSEKYKKQAKRLGLRNVIFLDHSSGSTDISKFLNTLDIYAHGRRDGETYGTVFAEALMHNKPCITHRSLIDNAHKYTIGEHGYFANNIVDYSIVLKKLIGSANLRNSMSTGAFEFANTNYGMDVFKSLILETYEKVLNKL